MSVDLQRHLKSASHLLYRCLQAFDNTVANNKYSRSGLPRLQNFLPLCQHTTLRSEDLRNKLSNDINVDFMPLTQIFQLLGQLHCGYVAQLAFLFCLILPSLFQLTGLIHQRVFIAVYWDIVTATWLSRGNRLDGKAKLGI